MSTIACGSDFTICIDKEKNVFSFGFSDYEIHGQKGNKRFPPTKIPALKNMKSIYSGGVHVVCLDYDGNVYKFGIIDYGQLRMDDGRTSLKYSTIPQKVDIPPCIQISCGEGFAVCLTVDGQVYSFGYSRYGELGLGDIDNHNAPKLIESLKDVEFIECGGHHTFCKTLNNEIYCWGYNEDGQLGLDNNDNQNTPILCSSLSNEQVVDIKCGMAHTLVLTSNGDVLSCGFNMFGQLGRDGDCSPIFKKIEELSEIARIACGDIHSICVNINNDLFVFGGNGEGQLGLGDIKDRHKPIKHPSLSNIIDISKGGKHTFVKTSNNEIYAFGNNEFSQLGIKTKARTQRTPIRIFEDNEDIWYSSIPKSNAKSARSILPRPSDEEDNSQPKKKQK